MRKWLSRLAAMAAWGVCLAGASMARAEGPAPASATPILTQEQLLARWLASSREVEAWRAQVGAVRFDELTAKLWPNPEVGVDVVSALAGVPPDGRFGVQGMVNVPLPIFGQIGARREVARAQLNVAQMQLLVQLWDHAGQLAALMVERASMQQRLEWIEQSLVELSRMETVIERRVAAGSNGPYDRLRIQIARGQRTAARDNARIARDQAEAKLLAMIADPSLRSAPIERRGLRAFAGPHDEAALIARALSHRPDLLYAQKATLAAKATRASERREVAPIPSFSASPYYIEGPYGFQLTFGVSVPVPLFDRNQGKIGRASQEVRAYEATGDMLRERIRAEVSGAYHARQAAALALETYQRETMRSVKELIDRAERTYEAGAFSITELLDAYQTSWETRERELDLERQHADAEVALEHAAMLLLREGSR